MGLLQSHHLTVLFRKENKDEVAMGTPATPDITPLTHTAVS
jgi:hypothetical protein